MKKLLFRVESCVKPELKQGNIIITTGEYLAYLQQLNELDFHYYKNKIEDTLAKVQGVDRRNYLFLFDELKDALIFSSKVYQGNARIYTVENVKGIQYKGDMNTLDCLSLAIKLAIDEEHSDIFDSLCTNYWKNGKTFSPCYEYLVESATIKNIVCTPDDCSKFHLEYSTKENYAFLSVERTSIYLKILNHL